MKTLTLALFILLSCSFSPLQAQTSSPAVEYLESVSLPLNEHQKETWQYLRAVTRGKSARTVEKRRTNLINAIRSSKVDASRKKPFASDASLKNAVLTYLDLSQKVLKEDFDKILDMEAIAEQSYDAMEAYILAKEQASAKLSEAWDELDAAINTFAATNNISLVEAEADKRGERIQQSSDMLGYYNDVYLIFFKSYKQEAYVLDAMNQEDINGLEQNISALISVSEEGLEKLKAINNFDGDASIKTATANMLNTYIKISEEDYPVVVDFFLKQDNFHKLQKIMDGKSKKDRTQQDVDTFNQAVEAYNQAVNDVNEVNEKLNKGRGKQIDQYNKQVQIFFDKHAG